MSFLLNPLLFNILLYLILKQITQCFLRILHNVSYHAKDIYQYKIRNKYLSIFYTSLYIIVFFLGFYILRLYSIPRTVDLKIFAFKLYMFYLSLTALSWESKMLLLYLLGLTIILIILFLRKFYSIAAKEIYKIFLYFTANNYLSRNKYTTKLYHMLISVGNTDIIIYLLRHYSYKLTKKLRGDYFVFDQLPKYHFYRILCIISAKKSYRFLLKVSPLFIILYDCLYNNFLITHVFYYMLFYIPLMLLQRITKTIGSYAPYINDFLWQIYYNKEDCIYAAPLHIKNIIDNYIISGLIMNHNFNNALDTELYIKNISRFTPIPEDRSLYINIDGELLHTMDNIKFFHIIEDDNGNPSKGQEWELLADKRKFLYD